ncbi:MAG: methylmalonyl-CoA epimerase [Eubacteriales bacterium]|nr:methylmalonyl-CoA epimerase [Eubacteriales bacterium]MDD4079011.1 methylmalonyl-CoA epimerase [Eubacteriales bacterium]MDD4769748.1 methylmalonyl-CoA epimerase [Eubacteriales bacterium]
MFKKIDHLGIAVEDLEVAVQLYRDTLGLEYAGEETVAEQKVKTAFFPLGESSIELLAPTDPDSPVAKFIAKRGAGIHHIAFRVDDVAKAIEELTARGVRMIDTVPRDGAHGAKIAFIHPKSTPGVLVELCQRKED